MNNQLLFVDAPVPPEGAKCWLMTEKGIFILQRGPGVLDRFICTRAGSGNITIYDGLPDERGFFPTEHDNGRELFQLNPVIVSPWELGVGFRHGLTIKALGGEDTKSIASVVWRAGNSI